MPKRIHLSLKAHHGGLKLLSRASKKNFVVILKNTPGMAKAIKHLFRYVLNGSLQLENKHVKKLKPHRRFIKRIAESPDKSINTKVQKGGSIFQSILKTVLPLLPALL